MSIVPKKPLITVEGRDTPYMNMKNNCVDKREPIIIIAMFEVEI